VSVSPRDLTAQERGSLLRILEEASFEGASELAQQVDEARVVGGIPTLLDLEVQPSAPPSIASDGPIPVRVVVGSDDEVSEGQLLVWVSNGYLSALEFAWVTDDPPAEMPSADRLLIEPERPEEQYEGKLDPEVFRIEVQFTSAGVRLTHLPTGLVAESFQSETSQVENRDAALDELREMLRQRGQDPTF
jgi:hypothetical protein